MKMDECIKKTRKVKLGDYVTAEDHNTKVECIYAARDWLLEICKKYGIDPKYVYELDKYLTKMRKVQVGDIIEPDDHNTIVEALTKLREILEKIETLVYKEGYEEAVKIVGKMFKLSAKIYLGKPPKPIKELKVRTYLGKPPKPIKELKVRTYLGKPPKPIKSMKINIRFEYEVYIGV